MMRKTITRKLLGMASLLLLSFALRSQPTDLFISEYVEGTSFNKALEIYNGTSAPINLATGQYVLEVYFNGASVTTTSLALTGTIPAGSVFVLAHTQAVLPITPDISTNVINFNGDDAVVLRKGGATGPVLDVIGQVGLDPGTNWGANDTSTVDRTIRRKLTVCQGDVTTSNAFYTAPEWDGFPQNTFGGLGTHTASCMPPGAGLTLLPSSLSFTTLANVPSQPKSYSITGIGLTVPAQINAPPLFELSLSASGPFLTSLSIPASSFNSGPVLVYVRYVPVVQGTDAGIATHTSSPFSATLNLGGVAIAITPIAQIQGSGLASTYTNQVVYTQGVVTADFQGANELSGFFIQDPVGDANPQTSEGIFVFNTSFPVNVGDMVLLSGTVDEFFNKTEIKSVTSLSVLSTANPVPTASQVTLPFATITEPEKFEGMLVQFTQTLTVTEVYTLARYGEVALSVNGRLFTPTNFVDPNDQPASGTASTGASNVSAVTAQQDLNNRSRILLDDKSSVQNPPVVPYIDPANNTLRCGSTLTVLTGIMDYDFSVYRIQPVATPAFNYAARPAAPVLAANNVKVASFNVLNYFNGNGQGGGFPTSRGANTSAEFTRQRDKIIAAIKQLDADILGLMEMENDGNGANSAIQDLVNGLNASTAPNTYTFVIDPTAANGGTGTDEIKVALIYKPAKVTPAGLAIADGASVHNRPPLAQTFSLNSNSEKFTVVVNHFKSKSCSGSTGADADQNDGQSCYNAARKNQAAALLTFIGTLQNTVNDSDVVVIGDLNSYEEEDPVDMMRAGGFKQVLQNTYSYVFDGQSGTLDHVLVSPSLFKQYVGAAKWHINADEPIAKDYNQEFNPAYMYSADAYRSSDHDPVIAAFMLNTEVIVTGIGSASAKGPEAKLKPNPVEGSKALVEVASPDKDEALVKIFDQTGKLVFNSSFELIPGINSLPLNLDDLLEGVYYVQVRTAEGQAVEKLVLVK